MPERIVVAQEKLLVEQRDVVERFRGKEVFPEPPKALLEFVERTAEQSFTFEPYLEPDLMFSQDADYPGWRVRPNLYFWDLIKSGRLSPDAARLSLGWVAMEAIRRPPYDGGMQMYENDPLAPKLEQLRNDGKIAVPYWCKHMLSTSRFGISAEEIDNHIVPVFARLSQIEDQIKVGKIKAGIPPYMAFNYRGNTAHPEWGETNTSEWFADETRDGYRLFGGSSDRGGLANVDDGDPGGHDDDIGFRLQVVFSSET